MESGSPGSTRTGPLGRETPSEPDLARAAAAGDPRAQRELLDAILDRVRVTVHYLCGDHRDRDDWVQLCLVEVLRSLPGFRGESTLGAWADRIAVRTTLRQLRIRRRRDERVALDPDAAPRPTADPFAAHQRLALRRRLAHHLGALDPECRAAVVLKMVHGYSVDEVAALTEAPPNTVRDRLARGRRQLRKRLARDPVFENLVPRRHP